MGVSKPQAYCQELQLATGRAKLSGPSEPLQRSLPEVPGAYQKSSVEYPATDRLCELRDLAPCENPGSQ